MRAYPHLATMAQVLWRSFLLDLVSCQAESESPRLRIHSGQALPRCVIDLPANSHANATFDPGPCFPLFFGKFVRVASNTRFKSSAGFVLQVFDHYLGRDLFSRAASLGELERAWGHHLGELPVRGRVYSGYLPKPAFWSQKTRKRYECIGELHIERLRPQYTPSTCCHETR